MLLIAPASIPQEWRRQFGRPTGDSHLLTDAVKEPAPVKDIDGSASRDFFTILSVGQYYSHDQWLNIQSFSMLRSWIVRTFPAGSFLPGSSRIGTMPPSPYLSTATSRTPSPGHSSSTQDLTSVGRDLHGSVTTTSTAAADPHAKSRSKLHEKAFDYCMRLVDQCDRKPEKKSDEDLVHAIWDVGEYSSPLHDSRFTVEVIYKLHDVLESMAYEAISAFQTKPVASARLLCVLMTSLAKESQTDQENRQLMVTRANELVHILKMPSVATTVMNPPVDVENRLLHVDPIASMGLVLQATSLSVH